ncbi:type 1 glutamine amidotransferase family protein [Luteipulveratus flavus]|uniref:Uncharacterized protein n=1 Tax=Luteipulveratus flavus TaxID=3031728 RepID=A0ABT6C782_9MICO|nr:hypothetical protein [Luteipulveratus sp. YIM 133296]MDF8263934.1 hypothetical protein [Luteipulveratus sp. YIM 133296]
MSGTPPVTLLGPQRRPTLPGVVESLSLTGLFAIVTAGWQEREKDDAELSSYLGGESVNLALWHRLQDVLDRDPEFAEAFRARRAMLDEMQDLYLMGVGHAMDALLSLYERRSATASLVSRAITDAEEVLRDLDDRHRRRIASVHGAFYDRVVPHERPLVRQHRDEVTVALSGASAAVVAGGHVAALLDAMHLFNVAPLLGSRPVIAWSAGAMALTERVVLFNDRAPHGPAVPEVYDAGLGLVPGVVALPSARKRLLVANGPRMATLARRFAPSACVPLDPGAVVSLSSDRSLPAGTLVVREDGVVGPSGGSDD